jgi:futalosine hydrolase
MALVIAATALESALIRNSGADVVVGGVGAVNTACALARHLATRAKPSLVIQTGIAGAFVPANVPVGSVLMADTEIYGDAGVLTPHGWRPMEEIGLPLVAWWLASESF